MTSQKSVNTQSIVTSALACLLVGLLAGFLLSKHWAQGPDSANTPEQQEPLYWVAPMDDNYRLDKPGKSPMGMDLVPVYKDDRQNSSNNPGQIQISPDVVNNLGVRTVAVRQGYLHGKINAVGYVQYDQDQLVHIHPRVEGWVEKLYVKASGDPVKKGQPLYALYSPQLVNAQEELRLALNTENNRLIAAAKSNLRALKFPDSAIEQLQKTRRVQQTVTFYANQSGVVDNLNIREGFYVKPGTSMMSIGALDQVWVEAEVFERQVPHLTVGQPVSMRLGYLPGRDWQGVVDYIYPSLDAQTRTAKARLRFNNQSRELKPNMFAEVTIHTEASEPSLLVPREAVIRTGKMDRVVLALGQGQFKSVQVILGRSDQDFVEVLGGVLEGEDIVSSAQFLLDSESSKTSDFKRLHHQQNEPPKRVWVSAYINSLMAEHRMVNVHHKAIAQWRWPDMTMDFLVADGVDFSQINANKNLFIEIEKLSRDSGYQIIAISATAPLADNQARVTGLIESVNSEERTLVVARSAVQKWSRPAASVEMTLAESIEFDTLTVGQTIDFRFSVNDGVFILEEIYSAPHPSEPSPEASINPSNDASQVAL